MRTRYPAIMVSAFLAAMLVHTLPSCTEVEDGDLLYALTGERPEDASGSSSGGGGGGGGGCEEGEEVFCISECDGGGLKVCDEYGNWGPCEPVQEICGNTQDDDSDGLVDEECGEPALKGYFEECSGSHECEGELDCVGLPDGEPTMWCTSACDVDNICPEGANCYVYCVPGEF